MVSFKFKRLANMALTGHCGPIKSHHVDTNWYNQRWMVARAVPTSLALTRVVSTTLDGWYLSRPSRVPAHAERAVETAVGTSLCLISFLGSIFW
jgi:hypothetical protein